MQNASTRTLIVVGVSVRRRAAHHGECDRRVDPVGAAKQALVVLNEEAATWH